jgi:hypothetical protein
LERPPRIARNTQLRHASGRDLQPSIDHAHPYRRPCPSALGSLPGGLEDARLGFFTVGLGLLSGGGHVESSWVRGLARVGTGMSTGHAHHFLSRLDRVSMPQVELALELYRDPGMLKFVLESAKLPEGAERVAIALEDSPTSPYVIVTREGRFVTCLGEGMRVDLPIVSRSRLDALSTRVESLRTGMAASAKFAGARGGVGKLLGRIHEAGNSLTREEMVALSGIQPLLAFEFLKYTYACTADLADAREVLLRHLKRSPKLKPALHPAARAYWSSFWAIGHFSVLTALSGPELITHLPEELRTRFMTTSFSWGCVRQGVSALAMRGVWASARLGKELLAGHKRMQREAASELTMIDSGMGLLAFGSRHARLRAETRKALESGPGISDDNALGKLLHAFSQMLVAIAEEDDLRPEELLEAQVRLGAGVAVLTCQGLPPGDHVYTQREDVPRDVALTFLANMEVPFIGVDGVDKFLTATFTAVPWVARASAEELYLPTEVIRSIRRPWTPDDTVALLELQSRHYQRKPPPKPQVSRQGPCPCGSGKKYKRCCEGAAQSNETPVEEVGADG